MTQHFILLVIFFGTLTDIYERKSIMKLRFLTVMVFVLAILCSAYTINVVMGASCYTLDPQDCTVGTPCYAQCTPACGGTGTLAIQVDRCVCVSSGFDVCRPGNMIDCFYRSDCGTSTDACTYDPAEFDCYAMNTTVVQGTERVLTGSGCTTP